MPISDSSTEVTMSFSRWMRALTIPLLAGPAHCRVTVLADRVQVSMGVGGWEFAADIDRSAIVEVTQTTGRVWAWGAHGWRGRWLVNGSSRGLVRLTLDPRQRGRCLGFPLRLREVTLSLDDPAGFIEVLHGTGNGDAAGS
jgi:hypothetical protein